MKGSYIRTPEHRAILSLAIKKKYEDPEYKKKMALINKGRKHSLATRMKISKRQKGRAIFLGKKHSQETLQKMRLARLGKPNFSIRGEKHPRWKGGRCSDGRYIRLFKPDHPFRNKKGYVAEHRLVMEQMIGRYLRKEEIVHHKNGIKDDNRQENLHLFKDHKSHVEFHRNLEKLFLKYNAECLQYPS